MTEVLSPRLPVSVVTSLGLHAGLLAGYVYTAQLAKTEGVRVISNVELMIQVRRAAAVPRAAAKAPPPSTWNFLKMALPAIPRIEPQRMEVKLPEIRKVKLPEAAKLEDRGRREAAPKLESLDLSQKRVEMAKLEARVETRRAQALAELPRLEEVGRRQVSNLPAALALEEKRQEAVALQRISAMQAEPGRRAVAAPQMAALQEAEAPARSRIAETMAKVLPTQELKLLPQPQMREAPEAIQRKLGRFIAPPLDRRGGPQALAEKKKAVEIEGPLAGRQVVSYVLPEFPVWAREQGVLEAAVAIRFYVSPSGEVLPNMRVEQTSGYGRLDRLAMESLKKWRFALLAEEQKQWGVITFRFVLE